MVILLQSWVHRVEPQGPGNMSEANSSAQENAAISPQIASGEFGIGTVLESRFELLEFLGAGAVGETYKAHDILLSRTVAIKFLGETASQNEETIERFKTEALVTTKLEHAGICRSYALKATPAGRLFMVMDFISGRSLASVLAEQGTLSATQFLNIFDQLTDALIYAHELGVVHRDLKPSNIMISSRDGQEQAVLVDFGLVKWVENQNQHLTATGAIMGTSAYMSPEQCRGEREIDERSDVYSLTCVMFEALTGKPPFTGDSSLDVMYKHVNASVDGSDILKNVPSNMVPLFRKGLQKNRSDRFQNISQLRQSFLACTRKTEIRNWKPPLIVVGALCLLLLSGFVAYLAITNSRAKEAAVLDNAIEDKKGKNSEVADSNLVELPADPDKVSALGNKYMNLDPTGKQLRILYRRWDEKHSRRHADRESVSLWTSAIVQFAMVLDYDSMETYSKRVLSSSFANEIAPTVVDSYFIYFKAKRDFSGGIKKLEQFVHDERFAQLPKLAVQAKADEIACYLELGDAQKAVRLGEENEKIMSSKFTEFGHTGTDSRKRYVVALLRAGDKKKANILLENYLSQIDQFQERGKHIAFAEMAQEIQKDDPKTSLSLYEMALSRCPPGERATIVMPYCSLLRSINENRRALELERGLFNHVTDRNLKIQILIAMKADATILKLNKDVADFDRAIVNEWRALLRGPVQLTGADIVLLDQSLGSCAANIRVEHGANAAIKFLDDWSSFVGTKTTFRKLIYVSLRSKMALEYADTNRGLALLKEAEQMLKSIDDIELARYGIDRPTLLGINREIEFQVYTSAGLPEQAIKAEEQALYFRKQSKIDEAALLFDELVLATSYFESNHGEKAKDLIAEIEKTIAERPDIWQKLLLEGKRRYSQLKVYEKKLPDALNSLDKSLTQAKRDGTPVPTNLEIDQALVLLQMGRYADAENVLNNRLKQKDPVLADVWKYRIHTTLVRIARAQRNFEQAVEESKLALAAAPGEIKISAYSVLAQSLMEVGDVEKAKEQLDLADELAKKSGEFRGKDRTLELLQHLRKSLKKYAKKTNLSGAVLTPVSASFQPASASAVLAPGSADFQPTSGSFGTLLQLKRRIV